MKIILGLLFLVFTVSANAAAISARLTGDRLQVMNGRTDGEYFIPSNFDTPVGLLKTERWVPGAFSSSLSTLTLTSTGGDVVSVPARLAGATYLQSTSFIKEGVPTVAGAPVCGETISAGQVTVRDTNNVGFCIADSSFRLKTAVKPFSKYQSILKLNKADLISAFSSKPAGIYSGTVSGILRYGFYVNASGNALTYRNIPVTFSMQIQYVSNYLHSVTVLGTGHISPEYDTYQHTAKGHTGYKITANGYFDTGLRFKFTSKGDNDYTLKPSKGPATPPIPYSIECDGCASGGLLVDKGTLVNPGAWSRVEKTGRSIPFKLNIFYDNVSVNDVEESIYRDNFTLMLEVIL
ncbi:hypothetical protein [Photobacterium indicum]|uniref:hypothetical protein n=1 Tax=Photobacterium indicum TaxID=81447 RepID=UPI003D126992